MKVKHQEMDGPLFAVLMLLHSIELVVFLMITQFKVQNSLQRTSIPSMYLTLTGKNQNNALRLILITHMVAKSWASTDSHIQDTPQLILTITCVKDVLQRPQLMRDLISAERVLISLNHFVPNILNVELQY